MQAVKSCKKHFFQKLRIYKKARNLHVTKPRCTPTIEISVNFYKMLVKGHENITINRMK